MELWIRSQNKQRLIKVESLTLTNIGSIVLGNDVNGEIILGEYSPYERALEILDEIQSKIGNIYLCKIKPMVKIGDARMVKEYLEENYIGDFIMTDSTMDIEPINKDVVMYEMPEK